MRKGIIVLLAVVIVCSCGKKEGGVKAPTRVKTQLISPAIADGAQTYVGIVEEHEGTAVSFTGIGVVKRVLVSEGQAVSRGQLIAEMDDTQARNLLSGAEAAMAQASDALERYGMLHDNGSLPEVQWVEIQSKVAQAKSQLEIAKKNLADCRLTAPVSGIIGTPPRFGIPVSTSFHQIRCPVQDAIRPESSAHRCCLSLPFQLRLFPTELFPVFLL